MNARKRGHPDTFILTNWHPYLNHSRTDPALLAFHYGIARVLHAIGGGELGQMLHKKLELVRVSAYEKVTTARIDSKLEIALRAQLQAAGLGGRPRFEPSKRTADIEAWVREAESERLATE